MQWLENLLLEEELINSLNVLEEIRLILISNPTIKKANFED